MSIRAIKEGLIKEDMLLDAFNRSANTSERPSIESWRDRWHVIIGTIEQMQLLLPNYDEDKQFIESILSAGKYAISHSPEYREAYRPHYRIVEKGIFEREIKPLITGVISLTYARRLSHRSYRGLQLHVHGCHPLSHLVAEGLYGRVAG